MNNKCVGDTEILYAQILPFSNCIVNDSRVVLCERTSHSNWFAYECVTRKYFKFRWTFYQKFHAHHEHAQQWKVWEFGPKYSFHCCSKLWRSRYSMLVGGVCVKFNIRILWWENKIRTFASGHSSYTMTVPTKLKLWFVVCALISVTYTL